MATSSFDKEFVIDKQEEAEALLSVLESDDVTSVPERDADKEAEKGIELLKQYSFL